MKDTSWGYYSTGSMDEWTKCAPPPHPSWGPRCLAHLRWNPHKLRRFWGGTSGQCWICCLCRCGNQEIYRRLRLVPRVMRNVAEVKTETAMLGHKMSFPVYISAAAKGGLAHADAEEALCRAAFARQTIQMCPHMATKTLDQMAAARARATPLRPLACMVCCLQFVRGSVPIPFQGGETSPALPRIVV